MAVVARKNDVLCAFSASVAGPAGSAPDWFASVNPDMSIKVWNVATGKHHVTLKEPQHLAKNYTCIAFVNGVSSKSKSSAAATSSKEQSTRGAGILSSAAYLAVGTDAGTIVLWSLQTGKVLHRLGLEEGGGKAAKAHTAAVNAVVFNQNGSVLYSCGEDEQLIAWGVESGRAQHVWASKPACTALALANVTAGGAGSSSASSSSLLLGGASKVRFWEVGSATYAPLARKVLGHTSRITVIAVSPCGKYFATGAEGDRVVSVWRTNEDLDSGSSGKAGAAAAAAAADDSGKKQLSRTPVATLSLDEAPLSITFSTVSSSSPAAAAPAAGSKKSSAASSSSSSSSDNLVIGCVSYNATASVWSVSVASNPSSSSSSSSSAAATVAVSKPVHSVVVSGLVQSADEARGFNAFQTFKKKKPSMDTHATPPVCQEGAIVRVAFLGAAPAAAAASGSKKDQQQTQTQQTLIVARNSTVQPAFEQCSVDLAPSSSSSSSSSSLTTLAPLGKAHLAGGAGEEGKKDEAGGQGKKRPLSAVNSETVLGQATLRVPAPQNMLRDGAQEGGPLGEDPLAGAGAAGEDEEGEVGAEILKKRRAMGAQTQTQQTLALASDPVIERRLAQLAASGDLSRSLASRIKQAEERAAASKATPLAGSLQTVLAQALHTGDEALLDHCLSASNNKAGRAAALVRKTVSRLAPRLVVPLLVKVISRLQQTPSRALQLLPWISESLRAHTAYLLTVPDLALQLQSLYRMIDARLSSFKKMLGLQGRLEMILSQVNRRAVVESAADEKGQGQRGGGLWERTSTGPLQTYDEAQDEDDREDEEADADAGAGATKQQQRRGGAGAGAMEDDEDDDDDDAADDDDEEGEEDEDEDGEGGGANGAAHDDEDDEDEDEEDE